LREKKVKEQAKKKKRTPKTRNLGNMNGEYDGRFYRPKPKRDINWHGEQPFRPVGDEGASPKRETEAEKSLSSSWYLVSHGPTEIKFKFEFDNPDEVSSTSYGTDTVVLEFLNLDLFKSKEAGEGVDVESFDGGEPLVSATVPPIISDAEAAETLAE
jgi:hypothetical protein